MDKPYHSIANDFQREAMIQFAIRKAGDIVRESFFHGLMVDDLGDAEVALFAEDAWERFSKTVTFDYPAYARTLFLRAFRLGYHAYCDDIPRGSHPNTYILVNLLEKEMRQAHSSQ